MKKDTDQKGFNFSIMLSSGDDNYPGASFKIQLRDNYLVDWALPGWVLAPYVYQKTYNCGSSGEKEKSYNEVVERCYGFYLFDGLFCLKFGTDPMNADEQCKKQSWSWFLPWVEYRQVRHSLLNLDHSLFEEAEGLKWIDYSRLKEFHPSVDFWFEDFDGEQVRVTCSIEERQWGRGTGWGWSWLSLFFEPIVSRSLDLEFSQETGRRKGSYKGGITGTSTRIDEGETPAFAFQRYCRTHKMTFIGESTENDD